MTAATALENARTLQSVGVCQHFQRWASRVSVRGRWVFLGLYETRQEAGRIGRIARELAARGAFARLRTPGEIRRRVLSASSVQG